VTSAATITVNDDGGADYLRIQDAIDNASAGDTIFVYNGTYSEGIFIDIPLYLTGESIENSIINDDREYYTITVEDTENVTINSFTIIGPPGNVGGGIKIKNSSYNKITECSFSGDIGPDIVLYSSSFNIISNCNLSAKDPYYTGFAVYGSEKDHYNNTVDDSNTVNSRSIFYYFDIHFRTIENLEGGHMAFVFCSNLTIKNCTIINGDGFKFKYTSDCLIEDCIEDSTGSWVGNFELSDSDRNTLINCVSNGSVVGAGFNFITSYENRLIDCSAYDNHAGIIFSHSSDNVLNNITTSSNWNGVELRFSSTNNSLINSTIIDNQIYITFNGNSHLSLLNTMVSKTDVTFWDDLSSLTIQWYLNILVINETGHGIENALVMVNNSKSNNIYEGITDEDGKISWIICNEYVQNKSTLNYFTPHTITVIKEGYSKGEVILNMDRSKSEIITLKEPEVENEPYPPQNLQVSIVDDYIYITWTTPPDDGGSSIIGYNIYRNNEQDIYAKVPGNQNWFKDTDIDYDVQYNYSVRAYNSIGEGGESNEVYITHPVISPAKGEENEEESPFTLLLWLIFIIVIIIIIFTFEILIRNREVL
jgi:parallel beta-helix repeat protein